MSRTLSLSHGDLDVVVKDGVSYARVGPITSTSGKSTGSFLYAEQKQTFTSTVGGDQTNSVTKGIKSMQFSIEYGDVANQFEDRLE
jgi:hypothetical protein